MDVDNYDQQDSGGEKDTTPIIDKILENGPLANIGGKTHIENAQSQSMVISAREEADEKLAAINARNAEIMRQQKLAEAAVKTKRTALYIGLGIFFAAILGALIWLAVNAIIASQTGVAPNIQQGSGENGGGSTAQTCTPETCKTLANITKTTILLSGNDHVYLYDSTKKKATLTTIPGQAYHAVTPFVWGGQTYVVLDPESGDSALYSITSNRQVTQFNYEKFYHDINNDVYKDMTWVEGSYIIASASGSYRIIELSSGEEKIRAVTRVFANGSFFFGKESDGKIHIYDANGTQFHVAEAGTIIFTKNDSVFVFSGTNNNTMTVFDTTGKRDMASDTYKEVSRISARDRLRTLQGDNSFFKIPL